MQQMPSPPQQKAKGSIIRFLDPFGRSFRRLPVFLWNGGYAFKNQKEPINVHKLRPWKILLQGKKGKRQT